MRQGVVDVVFGLVLLLIAAFLLQESMDSRYAIPLAGHEFPPMFYPRILLFMWLGLSVILVIRGALLLKTDVRAERIDIFRLGGIVALTAIYLLWLVQAVGFLFGSIIFAVPTLLFLGARSPIMVPVIAVGFPLAAWFLFQHILGIPLPRSPWFLTL